MVTRQPIFTQRRRFFVTVMGVVVARGICTAVLVTRSPRQGPENAGLSGVSPHLVPGVGRLHSGSRGTSSASCVSDRPSIRPIPPAGSPVRVYGGAPDAGSPSPYRSVGQRDVTVVPN
jgi:hypothetical protein